MATPCYYWKPPTFVDPQRFHGGVYRASNWTELGLTQGFRRTQTGYSQQHKAPKLVFVYPLCRNPQALLTQADRSQLQLTGKANIMLSADQMRILPDFFSDIADPRSRSGRRHRLSSVLSIAAAATLCGMKGYKAMAALNEVRAAESRRLLQDGFEPVLTKTRWCVLKSKENLTEPQRVRLSDLLKYNLQTVRAYLLKEQFRQFWDYDSPAWAAKFLDQWVALVMRSRIEPMKKVAKMLRNHRELILNYFRAKKQFSSGVVEGLNNKVKVTMRKSYGFRTFRITELALYHVLGKLQEPELTHRFY